MARSICDSLEKVSHLQGEERLSEQRRIYHDELTRYPTLVVDITGLNRPREFNEYNYRINRELMRTCEGYEDQFSLLPLSKILDLEGILNEKQYDSLEGLIIQFIHIQKTDLVIVTLDDPYPFSDFDDFVKHRGETWNIGGRYEKGGLMLAYSSALKSFAVYTGKLNEPSRAKQAVNYVADKSAFEQLSEAVIKLLND